MGILRKRKRRQEKWFCRRYAGALATHFPCCMVQLNWAFPESGDTAETELQSVPNPNGNGAWRCHLIWRIRAKPISRWACRLRRCSGTARGSLTVSAMKVRGRPVQGMASDDIGEYYDKLTDTLGHGSGRKASWDIDETHKALTETADALFVKKSRSRLTGR